MKGKEIQSHLFTFVSSAFRGTAHELLEESSTTLYLAINHADHSTRLLGLQKLDTMLKDESSSETLDAAFVSEALLARLNDDNPLVVMQALITDKLASRIEDMDALVAALKRILLPKPADSKRFTDLAAIQQKAISFLADGFVPTVTAIAPEDTAEKRKWFAAAEEMMLAHLFITTRSQKLARHAIKHTDTFPTGIFTGISDAADKIFKSGKHSDVKSDKKSATSSMLAKTNLKICEVLAANIAKSRHFEFYVELLANAFKRKEGIIWQLAALILNRR